MSNRVLITLVILSLAGFADAVYLALVHFYQSDAGCSLIAGCDAVLTSEYALVAGVPLAYMGVLYYLSLIIGFMMYYQTESRAILNGVYVVNITGFLFSLWLVYVQAALVGAFCQYCLISAFITTVIFGLLTYSIFISKTED